MRDKKMMKLWNKYKQSTTSMILIEHLKRFEKTHMIIHNSPFYFRNEYKLSYRDYPTMDYVDIFRYILINEHGYQFFRIGWTDKYKILYRAKVI